MTNLSPILLLFCDINHNLTVPEHQHHIIVVLDIFSFCSRNLVVKQSSSKGLCNAMQLENLSDDGRETDWSLMLTAFGGFTIVSSLADVTALHVERCQRPTRRFLRLHRICLVGAHVVLAVHQVQVVQLGHTAREDAGRVGQQAAVLVRHQQSRHHSRALGRRREDELLGGAPTREYRYIRRYMWPTRAPLGNI